MRRTADNERIAIEVVLNRHGKRLGSLAWVNSGNRLDIEPAEGLIHEEIKEFVHAIKSATGLRKRRLVRAATRAWQSDGRSAEVVYDEHRPRLRSLNVSELPFELLTHLYWRPQALGLRKGNGDAQYEKRKRSDLLRLKTEVWPKEETWVNKALDAVLAAAPPQAIAEALNALVPEFLFSATQLVKQKASGISDHVGDPDFALWDRESRILVLGESKIGAKPSNGRYSFDQFSKYMLYGALMEIAGHATQVMHLVIAPTREVEVLCNDSDQWRPKIDRATGRLTVDPRGLQLTSEFYKNKGRYRDFASWQRYVREHLLDIEWREANGDYTDSEVDGRLDVASAPVLVPTYVMTWDRFCGEMSGACNKQHAAHLVSAIEKLRELGMGERG